MNSNSFISWVKTQSQDGSWRNFNYIFSVYILGESIACMDKNKNLKMQWFAEFP